MGALRVGNSQKDRISPWLYVVYPLSRIALATVACANHKGAVLRKPLIYSLSGPPIVGVPTDHLEFNHYSEPLIGKTVLNEREGVKHMSSEILVLNLKTLGFKWNDEIHFVEPWKVLVDRSTPLGAPYISRNRTKNIQSFRSMLWAEFQLDFETQAVGEILRLRNVYKEHGKLELHCWCVPLPCHGDVIKRCLEWLIENY